MHVDPDLTVSDPDNTTLAGATVTISANAQSGDTLSYDAVTGITGSYDASTHVLTLSGTASVADYQTELESVTFSNTTNPGVTSDRTVSFQVDDGQSTDHASNVATSTVDVTAHAAVTLTVTTDADSGAGSLREALVDAQNGDTINFDPGVTEIDLASTLTIATNVTIEGHQGGGVGPAGVTINGQNAVTDLTVNTGVTATLDGLVIENGHGSGAADTPAAGACSTRDRSPSPTSSSTTIPPPAVTDRGEIMARVDNRARRRQGAFTFPPQARCISAPQCQRAETAPTAVREAKGVPAPTISAQAAVKARTSPQPGPQIRSHTVDTEAILVIVLEQREEPLVKQADPAQFIMVPTPS